MGSRSATARRSLTPERSWLTSAFAVIARHTLPETPAPCCNRPMTTERLQTVNSVLDETDNRLEAGQAAGAKVWLSGFPVLDKTLAGGFRSGELAVSYTHLTLPTNREV